MNSDDEEHSESEFYYLTEDFTFPIANKNEILVPGSAMGSETSLISPEEFREIQSFIESQRPDNTTKKTTYDINVIGRYFESINERREIENIPAKELNIQLTKFFMNVRMKNGGVYELTPLKDFQRR